MKGSRLTRARQRLHVSASGVHRRSVRCTSQHRQVMSSAGDASSSQGDGKRERLEAMCDKFAKMFKACTAQPAVLQFKRLDAMSLQSAAMRTASILSHCCMVRVADVLQVARGIEGFLPG